jgi:hypothetical protein
MNTDCAKEWSRKFIRENFTDTFINSKYKNHLQDILFDQEKALLPATQPLVEEDIRKQKIREEIKDIDKQIYELMRFKREKEDQIHKRNVAIASSHNRFIRSCPAEGCRGFLSSQWKCGICELWTCPDCHEVKGPERECEHTCDPNLVETAKLLAKDTKPCPKCHSNIFKISGCDQMWCTQCHTAFSWKTGAIEKNIHNPHYYEWQRKNGGAARAAGDIECGRDLTHHTVETICGLINKHHKSLIDNDTSNAVLKKSYLREGGRIYLPIVNRLIEIIRVTIHNIRFELAQFQTDYFIKNQDLRVQYLKNEISEEQFKWQIQVNDKRNRKHTEIAQVLQLSNTAVTDIVYRIIDNLRTSDKDKHNLEGMICEFDEVIRYCNDIFKDISFTYKSVQYYFNDKFSLCRVEKERKEEGKKPPASAK